LAERGNNNDNKNDNDPDTCYNINKKMDLSKTEENFSPHLETLVLDLERKSAPENFELRTLVMASASALAAIKP